MHRFQIDMTTEELESVERLGQLAGVKTKNEVIANALTLFKWAAKETLYGRSICSLDEETKAVNQIELPALTAIAATGGQSPLLSAEQRAKRLAESSRRSSEFTPELTKGAVHVDSGLVTERGDAVV